MESSIHDPNFEAPGIEELQPLFPAYEIEGFLAKGGMGAIYVGRQKSLDRAVAIKIMPREFGVDAQFRANFESEAKSMARLNHPNLIGVYDFGEADGYLFIIMELVDGKSLHHVAHGKLIEQREAARLVAGICHGLSHAHTHGILHRDIKPDNILLAPGPRPKIVDFGLARPMGEGPEPGEVIYGTPGYAAPEVMNHPTAVDHRADVFSAGVVLYELLTGQLPPTPWLPPSRLAKCDEGFDKIARRACHPSPEMRYGDAAEMADELESLSAKLDGPFAGNSAGSVVSRANLVRPATPPVAAAIPPRVAPKKSSAGPIMATAAVLVGLAAGAYFVFSEDKSDPPVGADAAPASETAPPVDPPSPEPAEPVAVVPVAPVEPIEPPVPIDPPTPDPAPKPPETVAESLTRLREKLLSGDRSEMPKGTVSHGGSHFLLVDSARQWDAASRFAEYYGAQLAVLGSSEDLKWAVEEFAIKEPVWLGLSDSGTEGKWHWVDGSSPKQELWAPNQPDDTPSPDDGEDFAVLLPGGILDDEAATKERRFMLQWAKEGENEGSLANQLKRAGAALQAKEPPIFPAGSRNVGGSRFVVIPVSTSWEAASSTAKAAGGHLAVPSNDAEATWLASNLGGMLKAGEGCWLGGRLTSGASPEWAFVTGEVFDFVQWLPGRPDGKGPAQSFLKLHRPLESPEQFGCDDADGSSASASCFVLEWSAPSRRNMPGREDMSQPGNARDWLLAHREKTAGQHGADAKDFRDELDKNIEDFIDDVEDRASFGGRRGGMNRMAEGFTAQIKESGKVPETIPVFAEGMIGDVHKEALKKQNEIEKEYEPQFQAALDRYLEDVRLMAARLQSAGKRDDAAYLTREVEATSADHDRFHAILGGGAPPVPEE